MSQWNESENTFLGNCLLLNTMVISHDLTLFDCNNRQLIKALDPLSMLKTVTASRFLWIQKFLVILVLETSDCKKCLKF